MPHPTSPLYPNLYRFSRPTLFRAAEAAADPESADHAELARPLAHLREEAESAAGFAPVSVTDKAAPPPSGDPKDYQSIATYVWPDPKRADGLPWIEIDGKRNPECDNYDQEPLHRLSNAVTTLALSAFLFRNREHGGHAARLLHHWYLDPETGMNPNLNFGQHVPGQCHGRPWGIIESALFIPPMLESAELLEWTGDLPKVDADALRGFFARLLDWLQSHPYPLYITTFHNNHGVYFDQLVARIALYVGQPAVARAVLTRVPHKIREQIEADGSQPRELRRANALIYTTMNLRGFLQLADMSARLGIDLHAYRSPDGRSIRAGVDFLRDLATGERDVSYKEHAHWQPHTAALLAMAGYSFRDPVLLETAATIDPDLPAHRVHLTHSATP
ncbi:MAG: alginate lyase family protein [Opitutales bacterium]|nr:alginate lyase family protein [Opitutales bacterium]